jgi:hypothetical protein
LCGYHGFNPRNWGFYVDNACFLAGIFVNHQGRLYPVLMYLLGGLVLAAGDMLEGFQRQFGCLALAVTLSLAELALAALIQ